MRILLLLLIAGLCLVAAKNIPFESRDTNSVLNRVRRSDSDSNTASVERDDDSSNVNENDDGDDNNSIDKKFKEEQAKLREKEEKKIQKLLEKIEKEKQKEIEEKRKLDEKFVKEKRKEEERKEKEERKLAEKTEKENRKREEEKRKTDEKLEKEERKRLEKLKKQVEKIRKVQIESAEDSYLETEEEDSVEIEDIWKAHVYDKYGLSITSTKLERQAALQRYLQEEMGINANSTKSERRQAILKLIQTKLQNDSATVDSFRNLLISHVNAAQIQKLRTKLENDIEELDNQTVLLSNISLPWASTAQQNIEEKRTFLQAVTQFLSNIVPNWFADGQSSSSTNSPCNGENNSNVLPSNPPNANEPLVGAANSANGVSTIPSDPGLSSSNPSESNLPENSNPSNNNAPLSETQVNGLSSNTGDAASTDSSNAPALSGSELSTSGSTELHSPGVYNSINYNVSLTDNGISSGSLGNSESSNTHVPINSGISSSNPTELNGNSGSVIDNISGTQSNNNGLPSSIVNKVNSDLTSGPAFQSSGSNLGNPSEVSGSISGSANTNSISNKSPVNQNDVNDLASNVPDTVNVDTSKASAPPSRPEIPTVNPAEPNLPGNGLLYDNTLVIETTEIPLKSGSLDNSEASSIPPFSNSGSQSSNPSGLSGSEASVNNNAPVPQTDSIGLSSNTGNPVNADASKAQTGLGLSTSNPPEPNLPEATDSLNSTVSVPETNISELSSSNPSESSLNNIITADKTKVNEQSSTADNLAHLDSSNQAPVSGGMSPGNQLENNESIDVSSINNQILGTQIITADQTKVNEQSSTADNLANLYSSNQAPISAGSSPGNQLENNEFIDVTSINNQILGNQTDINGIPSSIDNLSSAVSPNSPSSNDSVSASNNLSDANVSVNSDSLGNIDSTNSPSSIDFESASSNSSDVNVSVGSNSLNNIDSPNSPSSIDFVSASSNLSDINELIGSDSIHSNIQTDVEGLNFNADKSANLDKSNIAASVPSGSTADNKLEPNDVIDTSLNNDASINNTGESAFNIDNSANVDSLNVPTPLASIPSLGNPSNDDIASSASLTNNRDVTNEQVAEILSAPESSNGTLLTVSGQSSVLNSDGKVIELPNSLNSNNIPKETLRSANKVEVALDSNVATLNSNGVTEGNDDVVMETTSGSLNEDNASTVPVEDILIKSGTETVSSDSESTKLSTVSDTENTNTNVPVVNEGSSDSSTVSSVANTNGNEVIDSVTADTVDVNDSASKLEVTNVLVPLSTDTVTDNISANNQAITEDSITQDPSIINVESTTDNVEDSVITKDQNIDSLINSVAETNSVVTQAETRTEQVMLSVQDIMNTPNEFVTVASVQPSEGVEIPNEAAATIVDVKLL